MLRAAFHDAWNSEFMESAVSLINFGCMLHCVHEYGVDVTMCIGPSMLPTFNSVGDVVIMERVTPHLKRYRRGDVVIAKSPTVIDQTVCKRIRGLEGDTVILPGPERMHSSIKIPPGYVWLEGDNSANSTDSRYYGPVPAALIKGRVALKIWPLGECGLVKSIEPNEEGKYPYFNTAETRNPKHCRAKIKYRA